MPRSIIILDTIYPETEMSFVIIILLLTQKQMKRNLIILATIDPETDEEICNNNCYY